MPVAIDRCLRCGYNVSGLPPRKVCPECGTPRPGSEAPFDRRAIFQRSERWLLWITLAVLIVIVVLISYAVRSAADA